MKENHYKGMENDFIFFSEINKAKKSSQQYYFPLYG